jgi:outer membrane receptor protein involved in Fe transport
MYVASGIKKAKPFMAVSPRLGLAFPVTDRTVFHLQYGKFIQAPRLSNIYIGRAYQAILWSGQATLANPVGYNLRPVRSTQYEVGFTKQFSDFAAFDITGFYKDIEGQIQVGKIITDPGANTKGYIAFVNGDFVTTKGLEISLRLRRVNRIRLQFNYTYSNGQGTNSSVTSSLATLLEGVLTPNVISPLAFSQAHRGSADIDYSFDKGEGGPIFSESGMNLLVSFNSGHPYTKRCRPRRTH